MHGLRAMVGSAHRVLAMRAVRMMGMLAGAVLAEGRVLAAVLPMHRVGMMGMPAVHGLRAATGVAPLRSVI
jgi:hypothetical protein